MRCGVRCASSGVQRTGVPENGLKPCGDIDSLLSGVASGATAPRLRELLAQQLGGTLVSLGRATPGITRRCSAWRTWQRLPATLRRRPLRCTQLPPQQCGRLAVRPTAARRAAAAARRPPRPLPLVLALPPMAPRPRLSTRGPVLPSPGRARRPAAL